MTERIGGAAGHPPPLLITPGSGPRLLDQAAGTALIRTPTPPRTEAQTTLTPGSTLLLSTDGLIEHRDTDLTDNLATLADAATFDAHRPIDELSTTPAAQMTSPCWPSASSHPDRSR